MKGVIIWAQSNCRSALVLYNELVHRFNVPSLITVWMFPDGKKQDCNRALQGFSGDEFAEVNVVPVGENLQKGLEILNTHRGWHHLFCVYQKTPIYRKLMLEAYARHEHIGIMSESPCNMHSGWRKYAKEFYISYILRFLIKKNIKASDFFVNYSGDAFSQATRIGWEKDKIIPFGYYPPPIRNSKCCLRTKNRPFHILSTGVMSRYRGADVLIHALIKLKEMGVNYRATITQNGELFEYLYKIVKKFDLPVDLTGYLPLDDLIRLYETATVFVASGRSEPWGMRINDALHCGAPIIVSSGMGGRQLVDRYQCGLVFKNGNSSDLAKKLKVLYDDEGFYQKTSRNVVKAVSEIIPSKKAAELYSIITKKFPDWK